MKAYITLTVRLVDEKEKQVVYDAREFVGETTTQCSKYENFERLTIKWCTVIPKGGSAVE